MWFTLTMFTSLDYCCFLLFCEKNSLNNLIGRVPGAAIFLHSYKQFLMGQKSDILQVLRKNAQKKTQNNTSEYILHYVVKINLCLIL